MVLNPRARVFNLTLHCLLSLWLFFGFLELVEQLHFVPETGVEDRTGQDQDEEALSQLASGLKPHVLIPLASGNCSGIIAISEPAISVSFATSDQFTRQNPPPSLPLYQQFSVYRI